MSIGEVADPPFAVLPNPATLFLRRAERLAAMAPGHDLEPYLGFLERIARVQHALQADLPPARLPLPPELEQSYAHGMPPISVGRFRADEASEATIDRFLAALDGVPMPDASRAATAALRAAPAAKRQEMVDDTLLGSIPGDQVAEHALLSAALQVHFARLAARLDVTRLGKIADGACPSCGGPPVASAVVGWPGASGTRFCSCSICATQWHVERIRCLLCGSEKGIAYHSVEGGPGTVLAETCEDCKGYVKILHQHKDAKLDPVADDVGSLGLDLLLREEGWTRGSVNPFLIGY